MHISFIECIDTCKFCEFQFIKFTTTELIIDKHYFWNGRRVIEFPYYYRINSAVRLEPSASLNAFRFLKDAKCSKIQSDETNEIYFLRTSMILKIGVRRKMNLQFIYLRWAAPTAAHTFGGGEGDVASHDVMPAYIVNRVVYQSIMTTTTTTLQPAARDSLAPAVVYAVRVEFFFLNCCRIRRRRQCR